MSKIVEVLFMVLVTMAITVTLTLTITSSIGENDEKAYTVSPHVKPFPNRVSRFLAENKNPRAADHCKKDNEICYTLEGGRNSTCCNNKCMDLSEDKHNCGACKNKCKFTSSCCRGECVNLAYDKRHCGSCGNKCMPGGYCIYGLCNYA
uniref:stigma-specific STIG1-like protein 2 n=1 Tax=Erigeron canadensis TaxID=72917 RepID=UPI001CB8E70B|nr:stigma-specific STIG1-like protein 2 [Erigeron canadensis]